MNAVDSTSRLHSARPLLGTIVSIQIGGMSARLAAQAIERGFDTVAAVHRLMSFHEPQSDVSRLNCCASKCTVVVDPRTFRVIRHAIDFSANSGGCFDITVARELVAWGLLPRPSSEHSPDRLASWRDIELMGEDRVRFHRPLWIDLGGIAKGFAVDHALDHIALADGAQACVNAGGDLRVQGPLEQQVLLRGPTRDGVIPAVRLQDGSIASSASHFVTRANRRPGPHVHGIHRRAIGRRRFVAVIARECLVADALTKIALICGRRSGTLFRANGATAYVCDRRGWFTLP